MHFDRIPPVRGNHLDSMDRVNELLRCHGVVDHDPERDWTQAASVGLIDIDLSALGRHLRAWFARAGEVLARAGHPSEVGWLDLGGPQPVHPRDPGEMDTPEEAEAA